MQLKIMLVDDHVLFLEGLQYLLDTYGIQVTGKARNGKEALTKARILKPDIILMDIRMPEYDGLNALKLIKEEMPDIKVLMLTTSEEDDDLFTAIRYGASGYLFKNTDAKDLINMLLQIEKGEVPLSPGLAERILKEFRSGSNEEANKTEEISKGGSQKLTSRQIEVLELVSGGYTYKEAGDALGLSERTVKYHMGRIIEQLHLENKAQAIKYAAEKGIL
jgi:DNA-binding NarL/FixJ family response regulator